MTICPNSKHACRCQPQEGVMCPYGPTPDDWKADATDAAKLRTHQQDYDAYRANSFAQHVGWTYEQWKKSQNKDQSVFDIMSQQVKEDLHPAVEIMRSQAPQAGTPLPELWTRMDEYAQGLPDADQLVLGRFWNWLKAHAPAPRCEAAPLPIEEERKHAEQSLEDLMHKHDLIGVAGDHPNLEARLIAFAADAAGLTQQTAPEAAPTVTEAEINTFRRLIDEQQCIACEGKPSGSNNPCAICGTEATKVSASDVERALSDLADEAQANGCSMEWVNEQITIIRSVFDYSKLSPSK